MKPAAPDSMAGARRNISLSDALTSPHNRELDFIIGISDLWSSGKVLGVVIYLFLNVPQQEDLVWDFPILRGPSPKK